MHLPVFFINRDCDVARRVVFERELANARLDAERIAGVNAGDVPSDLQSYFAENGAPISTLSPGEMGCYASHLLAMRGVLLRGLNWALVLEDDVRLHPRLTEIVHSALGQAPAAWDFIKLCRYPKRATRSLASLPAGRLMVRYCSIPHGTGGYLVSAAGAKKVLAQQPKRRPIDIDMRFASSLSLEIFGIVPPITPHNGETASTVAERGSRRAWRLSRRAWCEEVVYDMRRLGPFGLLLWARCEVRNVPRRLARWFVKKPARSPRSARLAADAARALSWDGN